jgi:predicted nucleic acid-binding protein
MTIAYGTLIADSGFLIALFDSREPHHAAARRYLQNHPAPLMTVEAVLVEVSFFLRGGQRRAFLNAVAAGALSLQPTDANCYQRMAELSAKYDDLEPDYADLALIWLAEVSGLDSVLTLDERDFGVYRIKGRKHFDLVAWH